MTWRSALPVFVAAMLLGLTATAEERLATLALDGLSFVSFDGRETFQIPAGATIALRFQTGDGKSRGFAIPPDGVSIPPIPIGSGGRQLLYTLAAPAAGTVQRAGDDLVMDFTATVRAAIHDAEGQPVGEPLAYNLHFTTRRATATDVSGTRTVELEGAPIVQGPNHVQLVGGATNRLDAFPEPGVAVYAVLSGHFDWLPDVD